MPFDPTTIITSAVVGGFSGLAFATWRVNLEEVAKRRMLARDEVQEAVGEVLAHTIAYHAGFELSRNEDLADDDGVPYDDYWKRDFRWASAVAVAARRLGPVRRYLVKQRLRTLVGTVVADLAYAQPFDPSGEPLRMPLATIRIRRASGDYQPHEAGGLLDKALRAPHDSKPVKKLRRQLTRLAKSR